MTLSYDLPWSAPRADYERAARLLYDALQARENSALWKFKWVHPHFRGKTVTDIDPSTLDLDDARLVVAHDYGFPACFNLMQFAEEVARDGDAAQFERAVDAVVSGDATALRAMTQQDRELVHRRSARFHRATLLHYIAAN